MNNKPELKEEYSLQDVLTGVKLLAIINNYEKRIKELEQEVAELKRANDVNAIYGG